MEERTIWFIVDLIGELRKSGVRYEDMAADLYISERTIRNYAKGKIPQGKRQYFINYVKQNYREVFDYVAEKEEKRLSIE